jgi:ubiquinol-cytochrome c reductase cytochrome b/c1 subunit
MTKQFTGIKGWIDHRLPVFSFMDHELNEYPTPKNLNYFWNFGSLAGINLVIMIITGLFLAMHYTSDTKLAFDSVERIMRDVNAGWLIRYIHMNGASMFFIVVYVHMFRGLYYGSYKPPREILWGLGVVILLLMMATAFMGYVLPWGQMSLWGATVITNLFSAIPLIGQDIVEWLWGGFAVGNPTLTRFFALHFVMPFAIVGVVILHLIALHRFGSNNPLGIDIRDKKDTIPFHPYYTIKDFFGLGVYLLVFAVLVFYAPNYLGHPDNYIKANPMQTPPHIVPEWYFLPFYAILRAVTFEIPLYAVGLVVGAVGAVYYKTRAVVPTIMAGTAVFLGYVVFGLLGGQDWIYSIMRDSDMDSMSITEWLVLSIEAKLGGVLAMFGAVAILFVLPWLDTHPVRSGKFRPLFRIFFWLFAVNAVVLGYVGSQPAEGIMVRVGQIATFWYFFHFLVILPLLSVKERVMQLPHSISAPVLKPSVEQS